MASQRTDDPIALYYSQPAMRVHWVLEVRPRGNNWINRGSGAERTDSRYFRLRESWVKLIEDNGLQYKFLASEQVKVLLEPFEPTILASLPVEAAPFSTDVSADGIRITPGQPCAAKAAVYHLAFLGSDGKERLLYRANVTVAAKGATLPLPLALNDDKGTWTLEVRELATGATQRVLFDRSRW